MKNTFRAMFSIAAMQSIAIIAIFAVIGFSLSSCKEDNTNAHTHKWSDWTDITAATCTKVMVQERSCSCGENQARNFGSPLGHSYEKSICTVCKNIEMAQIPAGTFTMGIDAYMNEVEFDVTLSAFKMSKFEVTQELYEAVMETNPSHFKEDTLAEGEIQGRRPVETVTWFDAIDFCNKLSVREGLEPVYSINVIETYEVNIIDATVTVNWTKNGYRLPTEAQWEYACRAGTDTDYYFGDDQTKLTDYAWYQENADWKTHEVGKKLPNSYGLYDMHGNAYEWCWDYFGDYPTAPQTDYKGAENPDEYYRRIVRGGSYSSGVPYSYIRETLSQGTRYVGYGFRLVLP